MNQTTRIDWDVEWRYLDSSGRLRARILAIADGRVFMERWNRKNPTRTTRFDLPVKHFARGGAKILGWERESA